jgi:hypothetical protein
VRKDLAGAAAWDETDSDSVVSLEEDLDLLSNQEAAQTSPLQGNASPEGGMMTKTQDFLEDGENDNKDDESDISMGSDEDNTSDLLSLPVTADVTTPIVTGLQSTFDYRGRSSVRSNSNTKSTIRSTGTGNSGGGSRTTTTPLSSASASGGIRTRGGRGTGHTPRSTQSARESLRRLHSRLQSPLNLK